MRALFRAASWVLAALLLAMLTVGIVATRQGYHVYVVRSGSMVPTFAAGAVVVTAPISQVTPGQIVTFRHSGRSDDLVTHRVTDVTAAGLLHTKGDANPVGDVWDVRPDQVVGVERFNLPRLGFAIVYLRSPAGLASLILVLAGFVLLGPVLVPTRLRGVGKQPANGQHSRARVVRRGAVQPTTDSM